jgi:hypothetical protein
MKNQTKIKDEITEDAKNISKRYDGAPVVIIVAGSKKADVGACITGRWIPDSEDRLRDRIGIMQTAIQIESFGHLFWQLFPQALKDYLPDILKKIKK